MRRTLWTSIFILVVALNLVAQTPKTGLTRLLEAELDRFPARTGVYVKHLTTGEEAGVRADEAFSSASVIKIPIMVRAFQLAEGKQLSLDEWTEIRRSDLRDGTGILQYHDLGLVPTVRDLITEMVITSDNTATDLMTLKVGGVDRLNEWLSSSGYTNTRMIGRGFEYRRKLLALLDPRFASLTPEETTALQYAAQDNPLFELFRPLFTAERAPWVDIVRDPSNRRKLAQNRDIASTESCQAMKSTMRRQTAGARRIPHFLDVPVAHKTGDSAVIANDVGMVYARSGTVVMAFFTNGITGPYAETEDRIGRVSRLIVDYFDGAQKPAP